MTAETEETVWPWDQLSELVDGKQDFQWHHNTRYVLLEASAHP